MPAIILAALGKLPWKQIGLAVAALALALLLWKAPWAYLRGYHARDVEVANLKTSVSALTENVTVLKGSLTSQNAAIKQMSDAAEAKVAASTNALAEARKEAVAAQATADALRKSAGSRHAANDPCTISKTLAGVKL